MSASDLPTARRSATGDRATARRAEPAQSDQPTTPRPPRATTRARQPERAARPSLVLERYRLHHRLGSGGFGTVWMARDERLDRDVAVKVLPRERVLGGRFEREARAAARLTHPGIVTLYEAAVDDHGAYLVSELVRGETLDQLLEAGRLSDRDIVAIAMSLCEALSHAHAHGVVHRDVKPSNVLIPERPSSPAHPAKLTDFGVARLIGGDSLTRTGDVVGTAAYMAPEQAEGREAGASADLYAVALVAYEALTGVNPVRTATAAVRARRLGAHLPPLRRQRRELPRELGRGIDLALRPRPRERGTVDELHEALAASLPEVQDTPGVVAAPWKRPRSAPAEPGVAPDPARVPPPVDAGDSLGAHNYPAALAGTWPAVESDDGADPVPRWPSRALAATAAAGASGWLAAHLLARGTIAPAIAAMIAWMLVIALPRVGWLTVTAGLAMAAVLDQRPGGAVVLLIAALAPVVLLPRKGGAWALSAGAPALGLVALAGVWPALTPRLRTSMWDRAALAAVGWLWLLLAAPLAGIDLYTRRPPGTPAPDVWTASLGAAVHDVLGPIITSGALAGALVWALAAILLPWIARGRALVVDLVLVTVWAATTVSATEVAIAVVGRAHDVFAPPSAVAGAVASGALALSPALLRAWRARGHGVNPQPELP